MQTENSNRNLSKEYIVAKYNRNLSKIKMQTKNSNRNLSKKYIVLCKLKTVTETCLNHILYYAI